MARPVNVRDADEVAALLTRFVNRSIMAPARPMAPDDDFETSGVDSMGLIKILLFIEAEFGFWMPDADLVDDNVASPRRLAAYRARPSAAQLGALFGPYAAAQRAALSAWMSLIATFYDGRMLALMRAGHDWLLTGSGTLKRAAQDHIERHIALQASGAATTARYSRLLLRFLARHGLRGVEPADMAIR